MYPQTSTPILHPSFTPLAKINQPGADQIRLEIPAGPAKDYRLAQLDDYLGLPRQSFHWKAPVELSLTAKTSSMSIPGTWGFGFWNDPFSLVMPSSARSLRLPILPDTAWYFFASPQNYLSLRDDLPAQGSMATVFRSPRWPAVFSLAAAPLAPFLLIRPLARWLRRLGRGLIAESSAALPINPAQPHQYRIVWEQSRVQFWVDGKIALLSQVSPQGPLGLVVWIDNQFAAWLPGGQLKYGTLENAEPAWIEITALRINGQPISISRKE